ELPVDPVRLALDLLQTVGRDVGCQDPAREVPHRELVLGEREIHRQCSTALNSGKVRSSSSRSKVTSTGIPIVTSDGSTPTRFDTTLVPSSSSTRTTTKGGSKPGTGGWWWTT